MKLIIDDETLNLHTPNSYEVVITTHQHYGGRGEDVVVGPFIKDQDEGSLESLLLTLTAMTETFPHGTPDDSGYDAVEGFLAWFSHWFTTSEETFNRHAPNLSYEKYVADVAIAKKFWNRRSSWHDDATTSYEAPLNCTGFQVYYYDENKAQRQVKIVF